MVQDDCYEVGHKLLWMVIGYLLAAMGLKLRLR